MCLWTSWVWKIPMQNITKHILVQIYKAMIFISNYDIFFAVALDYFELPTKIIMNPVIDVKYWQTNRFSFLTSIISCIPLLSLKHKLLSFSSSCSCSMIKNVNVPVKQIFPHITTFCCKKERKWIAWPRKLWTCMKPL